MVIVDSNRVYEREPVRERWVVCPQFTRVPALGPVESILDSMYVRSGFQRAGSVPRGAHVRVQ